MLKDNGGGCPEGYRDHPVVCRKLVVKLLGAEIAEWWSSGRTGYCLYAVSTFVHDLLGLSAHGLD